MTVTSSGHPTNTEIIKALLLSFVHPCNYIWFMSLDSTHMWNAIKELILVIHRPYRSLYRAQLPSNKTLNKVDLLKDRLNLDIRFPFIEAFGGQAFYKYNEEIFFKEILIWTLILISHHTFSSHNSGISSPTDSLLTGRNPRSEASNHKYV